jgi:hypothetical protein
VSDKLDEMWAALAEHQPAPEYAEAWQKMLKEQAEEIARLEDRIDWLENGLAERRDMALSNARQAKAVRATARVAIGHLQGVLNMARTYAEQQAADTAARDWLASIGNDVEEKK